MKLFIRVDDQLNSLAKIFDQRAWLIILVLLPSVIALLLPLVFFGKTIFAFVPNSSDEIIYWREINTFVDHGFGGGQYSTDELPAQFAGSPFGSHGPAFAVLYGSLGKLFGWQENSAIFIHLLVIPIVLLLAVKIVKLDSKQLLVLALLLATWWPLQLYIPSNMQEVLHMSSAILLAALFYKFFTDKKNKLKFAVFIVVLLLLALPFRFIWGILLFPLLLFFPEKRTWRTWVLAIFLSGLILLAGALFVRVFYSPYPWFLAELLERLQNNFAAGLRVLFSHFADSFTSLVSVKNGLPLVVLVRYQLLGLVTAVGVWLLNTRRERRRHAEISEPLFHFVNLAGPLAFVLLFYDVLDTRDYRMFVAPLLLSSLLFVFFNRVKYAYSIIFLNLLFLIPFLFYYPQFRFQNFNYDPALLQEVDESINPYLQFDPAAECWCNTISVGKYGAFNPISYPLTALHSGFGITTILDWKEFRERPLRAQYVLLDPAYMDAKIGSPVNRFDLVELSQTPLGTLYLNPLADCD